MNRYVVQKMLRLIGGDEFWTVVDTETDERVSDHLNKENADRKAAELNDPGEDDDE